jgi:hypothetical protein
LECDDWLNPVAFSRKLEVAEKFGKFVFCFPGQSFPRFVSRFLFKHRWLKPPATKNVIKTA